MEPQLTPPPFVQPEEELDITTITITILIIIIVIGLGLLLYSYSTGDMNVADMPLDKFAKVLQKCVVQTGEPPSPQLVSMMSQVTQNSLKELKWSMNEKEFCKLMREEDTTPRGKQFTKMLDSKMSATMCGVS